jgi:hypothetical protein
MTNAACQLADWYYIPKFYTLLSQKLAIVHDPRSFYTIPIIKFNFNIILSFLLKDICFATKILYLPHAGFIFATCSAHHNITNGNYLKKHEDCSNETYLWCC